MITRATDYAIRILVYMSKKNYGELSTKKEVSERCGIPVSFLAKIVQILSKNRLINIKKGSQGGYILTKKPEEITLLDVIELIEGRIFLNHCIKDKEVCEFYSKCVIHKMWENLTEKLRAELRNINFKELADKDNCFIVENSTS